MQTAETSVNKQQKRLWGDKGWVNHYIQAGRDNFHEAYKKSYDHLAERRTRNG